MKTNKILMGLVLVLGAALIFETAYLFGTHRIIGGNVPLSFRRVQRDQQADNPVVRMWNDWPSLFDNRGMMFEEWEPFREMERIQKQINRMFRDSFEKAPRDTTQGFPESKSFFEPEADIKQTDSAYIVQMDVPGLDKEDIALKAEDNMLTVSGERKRQVSEQEKGGVLRQEREFGYFSRSIPLPADVKQEGIKASYDKGVLSVTLPRVALNKEQEKQSVKIKID